MKSVFFFIKNVVIVMSVAIVFAFSSGCKKNKDAEKEYVVAFVTNGGSGVAGQTVKEGGKLTKPVDPTKANCTFDAWYKETSLVNKWDFDNEPVQADMTPYAGWIIVGEEPKIEDYDIVSFGAKADGKTVNTQAIQAAIDRCSAEGGGRVIVPRGEFLSGTIHLRNGLTLHFENGAKLLGSTKMSDYTRHLIQAYSVWNIGITGYGIIDGSGSAFFRLTSGGYYTRYDENPGTMITLENCHNINIENIWLQNSCMWTMHVVGCSNVTIRGVTIRNPLHGPNNDGIDLEATRDVNISDCDIYTSDDAIVLKNRHERYYHFPCSNITVTNCTLTSLSNAFKIGTETIGEFRNIEFNNSTVRCPKPEDPLAQRWIELISDPNRHGPQFQFSGMEKPEYWFPDMHLRPMAGVAIQSVDGSVIDGVTVTNIDMDNVCAPIIIRLANRGAGVQPVTPSKAGEIKNISISNLTATNSLYASSITAIPGSYVENVTLENLNFGMSGGGSKELAEKVINESIDLYPDVLTWKILPASGFFVRHVKGLNMKTVNIHLDDKDERPVLIFDDVKNLYVNNFDMDNQSNGEAAIRFTKVENVEFSGLTLPPDVRYDLDIRGNDSKQIIFVGGVAERVNTTLNMNNSSGILYIQP